MQPGVEREEEMGPIAFNPPSPRRGVWIVAGTLGLFGMASASALATIFFLSRPNHPLAPLAATLAVLLGIGVYAALILLLKRNRATIWVMAAVGLVSLGLYLALKYGLIRGGP